MSRIEDESARMGALVEDLLTLARLDELPDTVREEVDLARLAGDAVDDARVTDPGRPVELATRGGGVRGDADQLRQVVGQPAAQRPRAHPAGTPVEVEVHREDRVRLEVRDTAPVCRPTTATPCSSASGVPSTAATAGRPEPGWAWRSSLGSSTGTPARVSGQPTPQAAARRSRCASRPAPERSSTGPEALCVARSRDTMGGRSRAGRSARVHRFRDRAFRRA